MKSIRLRLIAVVCLCFATLVAAAPGCSCDAHAQNNKVVTTK